MNDETNNVTIRVARRPDAPALAALIERSFRALGAGHYDPAQIAAALGPAIRLDDGLIDDGTYFVAEIGGALAGCGGWSDRLPTIREDFLPVPRGEVRAMFVDPVFSGRGVGRALLTAAEDAIAARGFAEAYLVATRSGLRFYERAGYTRLAEHVLELESAERVDVPLTFMRRSLR